jgi:hypothetical protein
MISVGGSPYNVDSNDNFIVVRITNAVTNCSLKLPTLTTSSTKDIGREITIQFDAQNISDINNNIFIQSTTTIIGLDGQIVTPILEIGDTIKFVSILENITPKWKVFQHVKYNRVESWKLIGSGGSMDNGQSIPNFITVNAINRVGFQPLRLRKVNSKYVHLQGNVTLSNLNQVSLPYLEIIKLPFGYNPISNTQYPIIFSNSSEECFNGILKVYSNGSVIALPGVGEIIGTVSWNLSIDIMIALD